MLGWGAQGGGEAGRFGRYRVVRLVGHGGMGEVYEAQQDHPSRRVALKVVRPDLVSPELVRRLDHEARILARLQHPGIAQIYDAGQADTPRGPTPYFAMEFVEGRPLTAFAKAKDLGLRNRLELFLAVCDAVEHAHRKGVIHRDLKPANILVDGEGKPRVLDFGVARATDADVRATTVHTEVGKLVGTLPYMSPEQVSGDPDATDTRSDVYSLGVVLYELLAGKPPYDIGRGPIPEAARIIRDSDPAPLSSVDRVFRGDLETIAAKALEKDKDRRYQSVAALASDVRRFLDNQPIEARPAGGWYQVRKFARRHRSMVIMGSLASAAVLLGSAFAIGAAIHATRVSADLRDARADALARATEATRLAAAAVREARTSESISSFLTDMFQAPEAARDGRNVRVVEVLDRARAQIEADATLPLDVRAFLRATLGRVYVELGLYEDADTLLTQSIAELQSKVSADDERLFKARFALATLRHWQGRVAESLELFRDVTAFLRSKHGDGNESTLRSEHAVVSALGTLHRWSEAEALARDALARSSESLGTEHRVTLMFMQVLGSITDAQGHPEEAEALLREAADLQRKQFGPTDMDTLSSRNSLAGLLASRKRWPEARDLQAELFHDLEAIMGPEHPKTLDALNNLTGYTFEAGDLAEAERLVRRMIDIRRRVMDPLHPRTVLNVSLLGRILEKAGRLDEAESTLRSAVDDASKLRGTRPEIEGMVLRHYAALLMRLARYQEAEHLLTQSDAILSPLYDVKHERRGAVLRTFVQLYDAWGKPDKAAEWRAKLPPDDPARSAPAVPAPAPGG